MKLTRHPAAILLVLAGLTLAGPALAGISIDRDIQRQHAVSTLPVEEEFSEQAAEMLQEIDTESVAALAAEPECGWPGALAPVAAFLQLDEVQTGMLVQLLQQRRIAVEPIALELRQRELALAMLLQAGQPAPVLVGLVVIEIRELRHAVAAIQIEFLSEFEGLLDLEQRQRLALIRAAVAVRPLLPAFVSLHLI